MALLQPAGQLLNVNSPIHFGYDLGGTEFESVQFKIFVWDGLITAKPVDPVYTLVRQSGFVSTIYNADIAPLIRRFIEQGQPVNAVESITTAEQGTVRWMQIDWVVDPVGATAVSGSSNEFLVGRGYSLFSDGANYASDVPVLASERNMLTDEYTPLALPLNISDLDIAESLNVRYDFGSAGTYTLNVPHQGNEATDNIVYIPIGVPNLQNMLSTLGAPSNVNQFDSYSVKVYDKNAVLMETFSIYVEQRGRYAPVQLSFINRYGVWDTITFLKASKEEFNSMGKEYKGYVGTVDGSGFSYNQNEASYKRFNGVSRSAWTLNTGYVSEDNHEAIKELMHSERVVMHYDFLESKSGDAPTDKYTISFYTRAVLVDTRSFRVLTHKDDKLVNYTIKVLGATDWNNNII